MATGLTVAQATAIMQQITSSEQEYERFRAGERAYLMAIAAEIGFDYETALNNCGSFETGTRLPSFEDMRKASDAMTGRLLTAHLSQQIYHPLVSGG